MSTKTKKETFTMKQLKEWEEERVKESPKNPKTGSRIQRDGPTYAKLEEAFSKLKIKQEKLVPIPEEAAASKDKMRDIFGTVMQATAENDPRTAIMMGLMNKESQQDYQRLVASQIKKPVIEIFDSETIKEMMNQAMESYNKYYHKQTKSSRTSFRLNEPSQDVLSSMKVNLDLMMSYIRNITRATPVEKLVKPSDVPRVEETPNRFWINYNKYFKERYNKTNISHEFDNIEKEPLTPIYNSIMERIYQKYNITKEIALLYTQFIRAYMNVSMTMIMQSYIRYVFQHNIPRGMNTITLNYFHLREAFGIRVLEQGRSTNMFIKRSTRYPITR